MIFDKLRDTVKPISNQRSNTGAAIRSIPHFIKYYQLTRFLKKSQWWSEDEIKEYQLCEMKKLVNHSYKNIPYYKKIFESNDITPDDIKNLEDIKKIPFLTKENIRNNINDLKAVNYRPGRFEYATTGGSTGFPLGVYVEKNVWFAIYSAFTNILLKRAGCSIKDKGIMLMGISKPWELQVFGRLLVLSTFHMNEEYLPIFVEKIKRFKPKYISGFPSALTLLASFINKKNISDIPKIKAIISSGETLFTWQKDLIQYTFNCRLHGHYALTEQCAIAGTCEVSDNYHFFPEFGITELINKKGERVTREGEIGEIVATSLQSNLFPFIRYRTHDLGAYTEKKCECGRNYFLLKKIEGRTQEFVVSKSKKYIPLTVGFYGLIARCSQNVRESQLYQDTEGEIVLKIVKGEEYSKNDEEQIIKGFNDKFGNEFKLIIEYIDQVPRTEWGKIAYLIQKLPIEFGE